MDVLAESRRVDCFSQEAAAQRVPASRVERLEERPRLRGKHPALAPSEKLSPPPVDVRFRIERVGERDLGLASLAERGGAATDLSRRVNNGGIAPASGKPLRRYPDLRRHADEIAELRPRHVLSRNAARSDDQTDGLRASQRTAGHRALLQGRGSSNFRCTTRLTLISPSCWRACARS